MSRAGVGGQSWLVGKLGFTGESAGVQTAPLLGPPWHTTEPPHVPPPGQSALVLQGPVVFEPPLQVWLQTGHDWMPGSFGNRSPVRKSSELSGKLMCEAPVMQFAVPLPFCDTVLMTHRLIGVVAVFGIGSGGPNRHPALVQLRVPHVPIPAPVQHVLGVPAPVQKPLPSASVAVVLASVSPVPLHEVTLVSEAPMSGTWKGSGTPELPPPV